MVYTVGKIDECPLFFLIRILFFKQVHELLKFHIIDFLLSEFNLWSLSQKEKPFTGQHHLNVIANSKATSGHKEINGVKLFSRSKIKLNFPAFFVCCTQKWKPQTHEWNEMNES